jgi:hypothetical protein
MKQNLPRGRVLQGEQELGMPSVSLMMQNKQLRTHSYQPNLYRGAEKSFARPTIQCILFDG